MVKLVDTPGSGSGDQYGRAGSIPVPGTENPSEGWDFTYEKKPCRLPACSRQGFRSDPRIAADNLITRLGQS